jgi:hypothetical protein
MWALYSLRILIVFALADISLRYVELPIRRGSLNLWLKGLKYRTKKERTQQTRAFALIFAIVFLFATVVSVRAISIGNQQRAEIEKALSTPEVSLSQVDNGLWVTGDSVILGIRSSLGEEQPIALTNARIGRQAPELLEVIRHDKAQVESSPIIFNLGNNGLLVRSDVEAIFEEIKNQPKIIIVNTAVPRPWREANNALVSSIATRYSRVHVIDWNSISDGHPEYFAPDGVHLVPTGVAVYVKEILKYL